MSKHRRWTRLGWGVALVLAVLATLPFGGMGHAASASGHGSATIPVATPQAGDLTLVVTRIRRRSPLSRASWSSYLRSTLPRFSASRTPRALLLLGQAFSTSTTTAVIDTAIINRTGAGPSAAAGQTINLTVGSAGGAHLGATFTNGTVIANALNHPQPSACKRVSPGAQVFFFSNPRKRSRKPSRAQIINLSSWTTKLACGDRAVLADINNVLGDLGGGTLADRPEGQFLLKVTKSGTGTGNVGNATNGGNGSPTAIACGDTCEAYFPAGTVVTLQANADPGSSFKGFTGGCTGGVDTDATGHCSVTVNADTTVNAQFDKSGTSMTCATALTNQGTPNEVVSQTTCNAGRTFNALEFTPNNGNQITNFFAENGQASCDFGSGGSLVCVFGAKTNSSGRIDIRLSKPPSTASPNLTIESSTDGGMSWQTPGWNSSGP